MNGSHTASPLAGPAGTPAEGIAKISTEAIKGTRSPEFVKRMTELGYVIMGQGPEQMTAMLKAEIERWTPVIKASGAVVE